MFATQVLREDLSDDDSDLKDSPELVGHLIIGGKYHEVKKGETKIGRDPTLCNIVIDNFTVSKVHAVIESEGSDDTFIYDSGSTNQTKLGKKVLKPHCRYKLENNKLTFGNVPVEFVTFSDKSLSPVPETKVNINPLEDLGDIFDVPTQVSAPVICNKVPVFEKETENFNVIKLSVDSKKLIESPGSSKNVFEVVTENKLISPLRTECSKSLNESCTIFNLNTQCQLYNNDTDKNESFKLKSLLNDGEDELLCTFMNLHGPNVENKGKPEEVKIKIEKSDFSQVLDEPTQVLAEAEVNELLLKSNKVISSTPLTNSTTKIISAVQTSAQQRGKDNFNAQGFEHSNSSSQNDQTESFAGEDLILTQTFDLPNCENEKISTVISEAKDLAISDEDFNETQIYDVEKEKQVLEENAISTKSLSLSKAEYSDRSIESCQDSTPVNIEDDLIATQVFDIEQEKQTEKVKSVLEKDNFCGSSEYNCSQKNNEDDFIATQMFELEKEVFGNTEVQEKYNDKDLCSSRTERDAKDELTATQIFDEEKNEVDNEDFIATQPAPFSPHRTQIFDEEKNEVDNEYFIATQPAPFSPQRTNSSRAEASLENSPDLLRNDRIQPEDCISTQIFDTPEQQIQNFLPTIKIKEETDALPQLVESSGDETESDLEILLEKSDITKEKKIPLKSFEAECELENNSELPENNNCSYAFELEPEKAAASVESNHQRVDETDSDATDCDEILELSSKLPIKQEKLNKVEFEDTQVLTLSLPNDFAENATNPKDDWMVGEESPKFEIEKNDEPWSPLSLEMPCTQDIEATVNRFLQNTKSDEKEKEDLASPSKISKIEVGNSKIEPESRKVDSPLKRSLEAVEVVPVKKSKTEDFSKSTEKQFLRLVKDHDIAQIQPNRTRNSVAKVTSENRSETHLPNNNDHQNSLRESGRERGKKKKANYDITPYLIKIPKHRSPKGGRKEQTSLKDRKSDCFSRILRSSKQSDGETSGVLVETTNNSESVHLRRSARRKSLEYFTNSCVRIAFTGFSSDTLDKIIRDLGGKKTDDLSNGEVVVVTDEVRRTVKFLCAVGLGLPIVSPMWLLSCKKENKFLNPWNFILKDEEAEEKWEFQLNHSLEKSKKQKLLQGYKVFATKNSKPPLKDLMAIVECCGGTPLLDPPRTWPKKTIFISCSSDKKWWPAPIPRNVKLVHYEFILCCVLRQKIDFKKYCLT